MQPLHRIPPHPGEILLREFIEPLGLAVPEEYAELVAGRCSVTEDVAKRLGAAFDVAPLFWLNLQFCHDEAKYMIG